MERRRKTINSALIAKLSSLNCKVLKDENLSKHTSFKIGGAADFFIEVPSALALKKCLEIFKSQDIFILGGGTNILFSDGGFRGIVLKLSGEFKKYSFDGTKLSCGAAAPLALVVKEAAQRKLSGLECCFGIPGSVGGAVFGNAGSANESISQVIESVEIYPYSNGRHCRQDLQSPNDAIVLDKSAINFQYRKSGIAAIIAKINFSLKNEVKNDILDLLSQSIEKRKKTQPINQPSAGCVFKNPVGFSAGKLIDEAGLKGKTIGGAQISEVHANFIVNQGGAKAEDVLRLIKIVKTEIKKKFNIDLEMEIVIA
ncbi:MAG: UDP-N-acetylmuramate dehydrogenase [Elusimicrobiota bacterium]|jgi:UDP-N-acetylmuramate dehydrogenase|nr:UDP-N-acetylmuramate dehydrogenase [Elusimicrobiota bacterium]